MTVRRSGMDHDRYDWSELQSRAPVSWPGGARTALWVNVAVQWFPLDMTGKPFRAPGGLTMPYPDTRHYSSRDYGNRVGLYRILRELDRRRLPASSAVNAAVAERYPALVSDLVGAGHEIVAHGVDAARVHHGGMERSEEGLLIDRTLELLRGASGQAVSGWLSPGRSQSFATPDLLAERGVAYCCDWANDDMPFAMRTSAGPLWAMPLASETDDRTVLLDFRHTEDSWLEQVLDRFRVLHREGGRVMSLSLHAWVMGTPARISFLREALDHVLGHEGVWPATPAAILAACQNSPP